MKRLDYISNLRFPLIAGVVFDHASYFMPASVRSEGVASMVFCMLQTVLKISVPVFFIISGFLFFRGVNYFGKSLYVKKIHSRVHSLLIPYVLWSLIFLLYMVAKNVPVIMQTNSLDTVRNLFTWRIFWMYKEGLPLHFALWYLRDLMLMCLISPVIWLLISRMKHYAMLGIWFLFMAQNVDNSISFPNSFFYFSLGSYFAICNIDIQRITQKFGWSILLIAAIAIVCSVQGNLILTRFSQIILAGCCIFYSCFVSDRYHFKVPTVLTDSVFFVYASHTIGVLLVANHISVAIIPDTAHPVLLFLRLFMTGLLTLATCVSIYDLLHRFFPKTISVLTGSR